MSNSRNKENGGTRNDDRTNIAFIENFPWYDPEKEGKGQLYAPYPSNDGGQSPHQSRNR